MIVCHFHIYFFFSRLTLLHQEVVKNFVKVVKNFVVRFFFYFFGEMFMNVKAVVIKICFLLTGQRSRKLHWPSQYKVEESPS